MPSSGQSDFTRKTARETRERVLEYIREGETQCADGTVVPWRVHPKYAYVADNKRDVRWFKDGNVVIAADPCQRSRILAAFCDIDQVPIPCIVRASAHQNRSPDAPRRCLICNIVDKVCGARVSVRQMQIVEERWREHQKELQRQRQAKRRADHWISSDEEEQDQSPSQKKRGGHERHDDEERSPSSSWHHPSTSCMPDRDISMDLTVTPPSSASFPRRQSSRIDRARDEGGRYLSTSRSARKPDTTTSPASEPYAALRNVFAEWERIAMGVTSEAQRKDFEMISRSSLDLSIARVKALQNWQH